MNLEALSRLSARLRHCADIVGSGDELSRKTTIPRSTLESYLTGASEPKASRLAAIAMVADVSLDWLVRGQGPMRPGEEAIAATAYAKSIAPMVDAQLIGRLTEKILLVYKETGTAIAIHQAAEQAAKEHNRIVLAITDPVERLIQVGEVAERLRQELRATAGNPAANKR